jgi:hypothetical protein
MAYPNVICSKPGHPLEPGYAVCPHVYYNQAPIAQRIRATPQHLGQILCASTAHSAVVSSTRNEPVIICATCAREKGWITQ